MQDFDVIEIRTDQVHTAGKFGNKSNFHSGHRIRIIVSSKKYIFIN